MREDRNTLFQVMNFQFPVGRWLMGIPVKLHWSLILLYVFAYVLLTEDGGFATIWQPALSAGIISFLVIGFVYLHECGHAFAFRLYDHRVERILLWPLGGICYGMPPRSAREELVITFFGPLVNLCFVVLFLGALFLWEWGSHRPFNLVLFQGEFNSWRTTGMELLTLAFLINFAQAAFNLLVPMFPMDCGRILRASLSTWYSPLKATQIVVRLGMILALVVVTGCIIAAVFARTIAPLPLAMIAVVMIVQGKLELEHAKIQPVYIGTTAGYAVVWQEGDEDTEEWKLRGQPKPKPGWFARWRARRQQLREELAAKQSEDTRRRVDDLLEKISREGIGALSKKERTFLSCASKSFRNRVG